jgi:hypothetical protein
VHGARCSNHQGRPLLLHNLAIAALAHEHGCGASTWACPLLTRSGPGQADKAIKQGEVRCTTFLCLPC